MILMFEVLLLCPTYWMAIHLFTYLILFCEVLQDRHNFVEGFMFFLPPIALVYCTVPNIY